MKLDAVIGCDAVDAGSDWLRLKTASGATRTLPWSAVRVAGTGAHLEGNITIQGVTEKLAPLVATHDSVWVVYAEGGFAKVMLEKASPRSDAILRAFAQHLGERWKGGDLEGSEVMGSLMIPQMVRIPKAIVVIMAVIAVAFFAAIAILFFVHGAKPTAP